MLGRRREFSGGVDTSAEGRSNKPVVFPSLRPVVRDKQPTGAQWKRGYKRGPSNGQDTESVVYPRMRPVVTENHQILNV